MSNLVEQAVQIDQQNLRLMAEDSNIDQAYRTVEQVIKDDSTLAVEPFEILPLGSSDLSDRNADGSNYDFEYNGSDLFNPAGIYFNMQFTIDRDDGEVFDAHDAPTIITGNILECFRQCQVKLGSEELTNLEYLGKADTGIKLVHTAPQWIKSVGHMSGFYPNETTDAVTDAAVDGRKTRFMPGTGARTKTSYISFTLPTAFSSFKKYLKDISFKLKLVRESNNLLFQKNNGANSGIPRFTINRLSMIVPVIRPNLTVLTAYKEYQLLNSIIQYTNLRIDRRLITGNVSEVNQNIESLPAVPRHVFIFFQDVLRSAALAAGATGHSSPFIFDAVNVGRINIKVNNQRKYPYRDIDCNFSTGLTNEQYYELVRISGALNDYEGGCGQITMEQFNTLYPVFAIDLKKGQFSDIPEINKDPCQLSINIKYNTPAPGNHYMYCLYVFDSVLQISYKNGVGLVTKLYGL